MILRLYQFSGGGDALTESDISPWVSALRQQTIELDKKGGIQSPIDL